MGAGRIVGLHGTTAVFPERKQRVCLGPNVRDGYVVGAFSLFRRPQVASGRLESAAAIMAIRRRALAFSTRSSPRSALALAATSAQLMPAQLMPGSALVVTVGCMPPFSCV